MLAAIEEILVFIFTALFVVAGIALVTAAMTVMYAFLLPVSYLLTMLLVLRTVRSAPELWEEAAADGPEEQPSWQRIPDREGPPLWRAPRAAPDGIPEPPLTTRTKRLQDLFLLFAGPPTKTRPSSKWRPSKRKAFELPPQPRPRAAAWRGEHLDQQVALPSYFFGPIADDIRYVGRTSARHCMDSFYIGLDMASDAMASDLPLIGIVCGAGMYAGIMIGGIVGLMAMAAVGVVNLIISVLAVAVAWCGYALLYAADWIWRRIGRVQMTCPVCARAVAPYPIYRCPRCTEPHRDIRPGPHGITSRICKCGVRLRTSLLTGAGKLAAECPACGAALPDRFGVVPEIVVPFFGGGNVGKTQLMYTLAQALCELVTVNGGTVGFDGDSEERLDAIGKLLASSGKPGKTLPEAPRAYILRLKLGLEQRLVYLFDAAGELHYREDGLEELNYLDKARVLVFVADPLAADNLWEKMPADLQLRFGEIRSDKAEVELAYQQTREQMRRMGSKRKVARLAFVISKADLLGDVEITSGIGTNQSSLSDWVQGRDGLSMGDMVREAKQGFASVKFFHTAAVMDDHGLPDSSVEALARWLMWSEGIRLGKWALNGS